MPKQILRAHPLQSLQSLAKKFGIYVQATSCHRCEAVISLFDLILGSIRLTATRAVGARLAACAYSVLACPNCDAERP